MITQEIIEKIRAEISGSTESARNIRINGTTQQAKEAGAIIHALNNLMLKLSDLEKECEEKPKKGLHSGSLRKVDNPMKWMEEDAKELTTAKGLEEEFRAYCGDFKDPETGEELPEDKCSMDMEQARKLARHFAQWGTEHRGSSEIPKDLEEAAHSYSESDEPLYSPGHRFHWDSDSLFGKQIETTFIAGAQWQKEQMLKEAVDAEVKSYVGGDGLYWEDVKAIVTIADDILPDPRYKHDLESSFQTEEAYYTEVLKRFKEGKV